MLIANFNFLVGKWAWPPRVPLRVPGLKTSKPSNKVNLFYGPFAFVSTVISKLFFEFYE